MAGTWDWKKEAERLKEIALEHQRKLETDPEYRRESEEFREKLKKYLYMGAPPEDET
jgi:hypothetical protein